MKIKEPFLRSRDEQLAEDMLQGRQQIMRPNLRPQGQPALAQRNQHIMIIKFAAGAHKLRETQKSRKT
jgi:hypothetical protein